METQSLIDPLFADLTHFLNQQQWQGLFSESEWLELQHITVSSPNLQQQQDFWKRVLITWDNRNLDHFRQAHQEVMQIARHYLTLGHQHLGWNFPAEPLLLALAETQVDQQQKQLIFWKFEYQQKLSRLGALEAENESARAEYYALMELSQFIGIRLKKDEGEILQHALDGLMGVLDAAYTAAFVCEQPRSSNGTLYVYHYGQMEVFPDMEMAHIPTWINLFQQPQARLFQAQALQALTPEDTPLLGKIIPEGGSLLMGPLNPSELLGLVMASSSDPGGLQGFRQFFEIISTHITNSLQNTRLHMRINEMAIRDAITGLYNRHHVEERLRQSFDRAKRYTRELSVIMVDIDRFKAINDTYGHQVGDQVLRQVSTTMGQRLRSTDVIGRFGGEEFMLILDETGHAGAQIVARNLVRIVEASPILLPDGRQVPVTVSAGIATYPQDGASAETIVKVADTGLYQAKNTGRNRVCYTGGEVDMLQ